MKLLLMSCLLAVSIGAAAHTDKPFFKGTNASCKLLYDMNMEEVAEIKPTPTPAQVLKYDAVINNLLTAVEKGGRCDDLLNDILTEIGNESVKELMS